LEKSKPFVLYSTVDGKIKLEIFLTEKRNRQRDDQSIVPTTDLQQLLLQGPTMSDDQWEDFKALRKDILL